MARDRRPVVLLGVGAALGLVLAGAGLVGAPETSTSLPPTVVARVNGVPIRSDDFGRLVSGLESDLRRPARDDERRRVLDRLIEEELLVQRGLELRLASHDRRVRADLVSAVILMVTADADEREPSEAELRDFYAEEADFFTRPGRLRARQIFFAVPSRELESEVTERARAARARLVSGESFEGVRREVGDPEVLVIPDALLPATKLREYVGPTALRAALALEPGNVSEPIRSGTGIHLLWVVEREPDQTPPFEETAAAVRGEWMRRSGDRALRAYLDGLRSDADVSVAPSLQ